MPHPVQPSPLLALLLLVMLAACPARAADAAAVVPHPVPWEFASARYGVTANGQALPVFYAAMNVHFASFDCTGAVDIQVTINPDDYNRADGKPVIKPDDFWQGSAVVRPLSRGIRAQTSGRVVTFTISAPGQYAIERPGTGGCEDEVLLLFANPPERDVPRQDDAQVIWLGPGTHQRPVELHSGQTLYLAPGAVLFGGIDIWDAQHVRICGRGTVVYYGPVSRNVDSAWLPRRGWHPLTAHQVTGLDISGVTFVGRSRGWTIQLYQTVDAAFANVKVITTFPENLNGDGIDWYGGGRATVRDCFFRTADDCFAVHAAAASAALRADRGGGAHLAGAPSTATARTRGEVGDITIERCVFWPTVANIFRAGWVDQELTTHDITIRDCDVIHLSAHQWMGAGDALFTSVSPDGQGECHHRRYRFEDIRCEAPTALLGVNWPAAHLHDFLFKDIRFLAGAAKSLLSASADGVRVEGVRVAGRPVGGDADLDLTRVGDAAAVEYLPGGK